MRLCPVVRMSVTRSFLERPPAVESDAEYSALLMTEFLAYVNMYVSNCVTPQMLKESDMETETFRYFK